MLAPRARTHAPTCARAQDRDRVRDSTSSLPPATCPSYAPPYLPPPQLSAARCMAPVEPTGSSAESEKRPTLPSKKTLPSPDMQKAIEEHDYNAPENQVENLKVGAPSTDTPESDMAEQREEARMSARTLKKEGPGRISSRDIYADVQAQKKSPKAGAVEDILDLAKLQPQPGPDGLVDPKRWAAFQKLQTFDTDKCGKLNSEEFWTAWDGLSQCTPIAHCHALSSHALAFSLVLLCA